MAAKSAREYDNNGFLLIKGCPLSREGVFDYAAKQVYPPGHPNMGDPNRIIGVYRPASALRDPKAIESFKSIPFIDEHEMLAGNQDSAEHPEDAAPEDKGVDGILTDNVWFDEDDGWLKGDVKIFGRSSQIALSEGKDNLSLAFACQFTLKSGTFDGKDYEVVQSRFRGNHLAKVDEARVDGARILDSRCFDSACLSLTVKTREDADMAASTKRKKAPAVKKVRGRAADSALDQLKAMVPALQGIIAAGEKGELDCDDSAEDSSDEGTEVTSEVDDGSSDDDSSENDEADDIYEDDTDADGDADGVDDDSESDDRDVDAGNAVVEQAKALLAAIKELSTNDQAEDDADESDDDDSDDVDGAGMDSDEMEKDREDKRDVADIERRVGDSALRRMYADKAKKDRLQKRLSNVIGSFNGDVMDSKDMAAYGVRRLGLKAGKGEELTVLNAYLDGVSAQQKKNRKTVASRAMDSKVAVEQLDKYLAEGAK